MQGAWIQRPLLRESEMNTTQAVLSAYLAGSRTADEINAITGIGINKISKATYFLVKRGLIARTGNSSKFTGGNTAGFYEPVEGKAAA